MADVAVAPAEPVAPAAKLATPVESAASAECVATTERIVSTEFTECSEQKTELIPPSELAERLRKIREKTKINQSSALVGDVPPLDDLVVPEGQGIRTLVRSLTGVHDVPSSCQESCQWLTLRASVDEGAESSHEVLAVTQTPRDIKFSVRIPAKSREANSPRQPPLGCELELYYDPASDNQILLNQSNVPISLTRSSSATPDSDDSPHGFVLNPEDCHALEPGSWRITASGINLLDLRIIEKRPNSARPPAPSSSSSPSLPSSPNGSSSVILNSSGKRLFIDDDDTNHHAFQGKKPRISEASQVRQEGVVMLKRSGTAKDSRSLVFSLPAQGKQQQLAKLNAHPLLDLECGATAVIPGTCKTEEYRIIKKETLSSTILSTVFTAEQSGISNADGLITVKVLRTLRPPLPGSPTTGPAPGGSLNRNRDVIQKAEIWLREYRSQEDLKHDSIVRLLGGDARGLCLFMEPIDAYDLSTPKWRDAPTDRFTGSADDAIRIFRDISGALKFIHSHQVVHNDIKPANILYSCVRGGVLCDFGLATNPHGSAPRGGTPYYVPPEFIASESRGPPGDVWALGVTMLYVLGKLALPDSRGRAGHPHKLHWHIADVPRKVPAAIEQMRLWLEHVRAARDQLDQHNQVEDLVYKMLFPNPSQRITAKEIFRKLRDMKPTVR